jgi:hypothetical protein
LKAALEALRFHLRRVLVADGLKPLGCSERLEALGQGLTLATEAVTIVASLPAPWTRLCRLGAERAFARGVDVVGDAVARSSARASASQRARLAGACGRGPKVSST